MDQAQEDQVQQRINVEYDINNDANYKSSFLEARKKRASKCSDPENYNENACFICQNGQEFTSNGRVRKFPPIDPETIKKLDDLADQYFRASTLSSSGIYELAKQFNSCVVDCRNSVGSKSLVEGEEEEDGFGAGGEEALCALFAKKPRLEDVEEDQLATLNDDTQDSNLFVQYSYVTAGDMERHYLGCVNSPLVKAQLISNYIDDVLHEIVEVSGNLTYEHVDKQNPTGKPVKKLNLPVVKEFNNTAKTGIMVKRVLDQLLKSHTGSVYNTVVVRRRKK